MTYTSKSLGSFDKSSMNVHGISCIQEMTYKELLNEVYYLTWVKSRDLENVVHRDLYFDQ
jgi:hypothetical protein